MAAAYCSICFENLRLEQFRIIPCGHGYCTGCLDGLIGTGRNFSCPSCRAKFPRAAPHKICLDIVDAKTFFVTDVLDKLGQMNENTKLGSVEKAAEKITKAAKLAKNNENLAGKLLKAVEGFKEYVVPAFQKAEEAHIEIEKIQESLKEKQGQQEADAVHARALENELKELRNRLKRRDAEVDQVNSKLEKAEKERDEALTLAEKATFELIQIKDTNNKLLKSADETFETTKILKRQLEWYKSEHSNQANEIVELNKYCTELQSKLVENEQEKENLTSTLQQSQAQARRLSNDNQWYNGYDDGPNQQSLELDVEGIPAIQFGSGWQLNKPRSTTKQKLKRPVSAGGVSSAAFPIKLDAKGRPLVPVQSGPRATKRVKI